MEKKMRVLIAEPEKAPYPLCMENTQKAVSDFLGGSCEALMFPEKEVLLFYNDQGRAIGPPPNRAMPGDERYLCGTFLLCGFQGVFLKSLTPVPLSEYLHLLSNPDIRLNFGENRIEFVPVLNGRSHSDTDESGVDIEHEVKDGGAS